MVDEVFVGRRDEQARFAALLTELTASKGGWPRGRPSREAPAAASRSRVVLVHGLGGSGKSRLLSQFRDMAQGWAPGSPVSPGQVRTVWLDWEDEQRDDPGRYAELAGPSVVTVLDLAGALSGLNPRRNQNSSSYGQGQSSSGAGIGFAM